MYKNIFVVALLLLNISFADTVLNETTRCFLKRNHLTKNIVGYTVSFTNDIMLDKIWKLSFIHYHNGQTTIANLDNYTVQFKSNGTLTVRADCNTCSGGYTMNPDTFLLSITPLGCTKMFCGSDLKGDLFAGILSNVSRYAITSDTLLCIAASDTLVFIEAATKTKPSMRSESGRMTETDINILSKHQVMTVCMRGEVMTHVRLLNIRGICMRIMAHIVDNRAMINAAGLPVGVYLA